MNALATKDFILGLMLGFMMGTAFTFVLFVLAKL